MSLQSTRRIRQTLLAAAIALGGTAAFAQYTGPAGTPAGKAASAKNVAEVLKSPVDNTQVAFDGHILRKLSSDKYMFSDGTGEIRVEIDAKRLPATPINEKTKVQIRGEVEKDFMESPQIDVDTVTVKP